MESTIRWILLLIGTLVILGIWWDGMRRSKKRKSSLPEEKKISVQKGKKQELQTELIEPLEEKTISAESIRISEDEPILNEEVLKDLATAHHAQIKETELEQKPDIISIYVMAPEGKSFGGYDLLQTILAYDMQYGEMQIFHRYVDNKAKTDLLFSLVSATEPGDFDLQEMGSFSCRGLILFMDVSKLEHPHQVFELMLETANHLAEDLDGELQLNQTEVLTQEAIEAIRKRLRA
jgi:cell division protein ZipA